MNNHDKTFEQAHLDEQLNHPANHLAPDEQRLVQDLQHAYYSYEQENAQSLQHVWMRLESQRRHTQGKTGTASISSLQRKQKMKDTSFSGNSSQNSIKSTLTLIAAVLVVAILAGSTYVVFHAARQNNPTSRVDHNHLEPQPTATPVVDSSGIYIEYMSKQNTYVLAKLDAKSHIPVWTFQRGDLDINYPTIHGDTVFLNASDDTANQSHLIALNATTGKLLWDRSFKRVISTPAVEGNSPDNLGILTAPVASNGLVFVTNRAGTVFAFDAATGKQKWTCETGASALVKSYYTDPTTGKPKVAGETIYDGSTPQVSNGVLYGALEKTLYAINIQTGKQVWTSKLTSQDQIFGDAQVIDGVIYASSYSVSQHTASQAYKSYVYAFNAKNGKQNWNYATQSLVSSSLAIDSRHIYFIARYPSGDNLESHSTLYALNLQGEKAWEHDYHNPAVVSLIAGDGYVSVSGGTYDQGKVVSYTLYVLKANGQNAWQKNVEADPVSIEDSVLYTKSGRKIIAYDLTSQKELWDGQYGENVVDNVGFSFHLGWIVVVP